MTSIHTLSLRQICDEVRAKELQQDLEMAQIVVHEVERQKGCLFVRLTDYAATSLGDHLNRSRSPVKIHLECSEFTATKLQKNFRAAMESINESEQYNAAASADLPQAAVSNTYQSRHLVR